MDSFHNKVEEIVEANTFKLTQKGLERTRGKGFRIRKELGGFLGGGEELLLVMIKSPNKWWTTSELLQPFLELGPRRIKEGSGGPMGDRYYWSPEQISGRYLKDLDGLVRHEYVQKKTGVYKKLTTFLKVARNWEMINDGL
jgi:hypothetical protein